MCLVKPVLLHLQRRFSEMPFTVKAEKGREKKELLRGQQRVTIGLDMKQFYGGSHLFLWLKMSH